MTEAFHFLRPEWLLLVPAFFALIWWHQRTLNRGGVWNRLIDSALLPFVVNESAQRGLRTRGGLLALATSLALLALAGPTWERVPVPVFRSESALVIVLDLSASMNAADVLPSRLALAKFKIADLLKLRKSGQTALVVFAAQSFVVTPLTDDTTTLLGQLQGLDTSIMPSQGSEPASALEQAAALLVQAGIVSGHVLLITDGADADALARAHVVLGDRNYSLSVLGVGTAEGAPIPDRSGGFAKRPDGEIILSTLMTAQLAELARMGDGLYLDLAPDDAEVRRLEIFLERQLDNRAQELDDLAASQWREFGPWLLLALLPLAACGFRRGVIVGLSLCILPMTSEPALAAWWQTDDQAAAAAFQRGEYDRAANQFATPGWRGAARYRAGDYADAVSQFATSDDALAHYNRANALARLGRYEEAIAGYAKALEHTPGDADASYNKKLLEDLLRQQQPPPPEQGQADKKKPDDKKQAADDQSEGQDGGGQEGQEGDQEISGANAAGGSEQQSGEEANMESQSQAGASGEQTEDEDPTDEQSGEDKTIAKQQSAEALSESDAERAQATEQWLRQIPDDPSGLLRRKFQYQYKQRYGNQPYEGNRW